MTNKQENATVVWEAVKDLILGDEELSHMTGDFELCGKTADDVLREIKENDKNKKK